jgi:hypothetical protein
MAPPSEFDLRAALREGEGDKPNIHRVMVAVDARRQRRVRLASAAVIVAVAGGLGVTAAVFGGSNHESGGSAVGAGGALNADNGGGTALEPSDPKAALARVSCPSAAPYYAAHETNRIRGSAHSNLPLFTAPVSSVVVCAYGPAFQSQALQRRSPVRLELAGSQAKRVAQSLENAPSTAPTTSCSGSSIEQYAVIPVDASGNQGRPVIAQVPSSPCGALVTNGTAIRYDWRPPPAVAAKLDEISPTGPADSLAPAPAPTPSPTS